MTTLLENEILRVTPTGEFIWHEDADRMIEENNFSHSPAMPYILKALKKRQWVGLTDEEFSHYAHWIYPEKLSELENLLKNKNT